MLEQTGAELSMDELFQSIAEHVALVIEACAVLIVAFGSAQALVGVFGVLVRPGREELIQGRLVWRRFGRWLVLGLEFALAADIVRSASAPTWEEIGQLAAIAAVRSFLSYFLEKDLETVGREDGS